MHPRITLNYRNPVVVSLSWLWAPIAHPGTEGPVAAPVAPGPG
jgi:hypothetical protein